MLIDLNLVLKFNLGVTFSSNPSTDVTWFYTLQKSSVT